MGTLIKYEVLPCGKATGGIVYVACLRMAERIDHDSRNVVQRVNKTLAFCRRIDFGGKNRFGRQIRFDFCRLMLRAPDMTICGTALRAPR
jgi:hypothetical protein